MATTVGKFRAGVNLAALWIALFFLADYFVYGIRITVKIICALPIVAHSIASFVYIGRIRTDNKTAVKQKKPLWVMFLIGLILTVTTGYAGILSLSYIAPTWLKSLVVPICYILLFRLPYFSLKKQNQKEAPEDV